MRLMTVHRAKGLEFPVVCVADLGKDGREDYGALRISDDGLAGLRLASLGGGSGRQRPSSSADQGRSEKAVGEEEERRIFYVAATRAQEHLVLSGATDLEKLPGAGGHEGADALAAARLRPEPGVRRTELTPGERRRAAARRRPRPRAPPSPSRPAATPSRSSASARCRRRGRCPSAGSPTQRPRGYRRCSYRFYLERALRLPTGRVALRTPTRCPRRASAPCCAGRSCTSCSSGSTSAARPCRRRTRSAR